MDGRFRGRVQPDPDAETLARRMAGNDRVMRTILDETIASGDEGVLLESGRTVCGGDADVQGPVNRFPRAVDLKRCPVGLAGVWHTHVADDQLLSPSNSLPDIANVIFGAVDAHLVVGTQSGEAVVAPDNDETAREAFRNALGVEVYAVEDVVEALQTRRISDPARARNRVRKQLDPLVFRFTTGYTELTDAARDQLRTQQAQTVRPRAPPETTGPDVGNLRRRSRNAAQILANINQKFGVTEEAVSSAVGIVVGSVVSSVIGTG